MQTDSTSIQKPDSIVQAATLNIPSTKPLTDVQDSIMQSEVPLQKRETRNNDVKPVVEQLVADTAETNAVPQETFRPFAIGSKHKHTDSSVYHPKVSASGLVAETAIGSNYVMTQRPTEGTKEKNWVFGISIVAIFVMLSVVLYFNKQLKPVVASLFNFQLSDKLGREKNAMIKRVFLLLNINFVLAFTFYFYIFVQNVFGKNTQYTQFTLFALVMGIVVSFIIVRYVLLYFIGNVFDSKSIFKEFVHNSLLLSKNTGIYLMPLVLCYFFIPEGLKQPAFYLSTAIVLFMLLYRYLRSLQIILRHKVLYFYTILYLCTLEILPVIVGFKFVLSLR